MARSFSKNSKYDVHPGDDSRKGYQRLVNKKFRAETKRGLRFGGELPVMRRVVDRLAH